MLEFVALGSDPAAAKAVAQEHGGVAYLSSAGRSSAGLSSTGLSSTGTEQGRPFASLVRVATSDPSALAAASDIGLYLSYSRTMRSHPQQWHSPNPTPGVVAVFGMVRRADLTHAQVDAHWRDTHAPLALRIHIGMWAYTQCSVVHTFSGPDHYDGFALCAFGSDADLRERFFDGPEGQEAIRDDVAKMADPQRSPRRVLCTEWSFR